VTSIATFGSDSGGAVIFAREDDPGLVDDFAVVDGKDNICGREPDDVGVDCKCEPPPQPTSPAPPTHNRPSRSLLPPLHNRICSQDGMHRFSRL
jgi:hypothetical protein